MDPSVAARLHNLYWSIGTVGFIVLGSAGLGHAARLTARWRGATLGVQRRAFWGYALSAPWVLGFLVFVLGPALASLYYSFTDYRLGEPLAWLGLENYRILIEGIGAHGRRFVQALHNSFYYALVGVPLQIATALGMALLVSRPLPGMSLFRLVFYLPVILAGGPAILLAWRYMLASNGGFVNLTLAGIADAVPPLGWAYRTFILLVESFNAFYAGVTRGDPLGPLGYFLPALLASALIAHLLAGPWHAGRASLAARSAEIIGLALAVPLLARGIVADPFDARVLLALAAAAAAFAGLRGHGRARRLRLVGAGVLTLALAASLAPGQLDEGRWRALLDLTLLRSVLQGRELAYLGATLPAALPAPAWVWAALAGLAATVASPALGARARRVALVSGLVAFGLLAVGSLIDGVRYFRAFAETAAANGEPLYHFALFRQVVQAMPSGNRVPLWLQSELWSKPSLVLITMWSSGAGMLIFLAALKGVPRGFYEAAEVDGATRWQRFRHVTLPMISPATFYNVVIGMIAALQTFEAVYIIQTQQTENSLASAAYFLFVRTFRQLEIGQGAAASWILAVVIVLLTALQFRYGRWVHYGG